MHGEVSASNMFANSEKRQRNTGLAPFKALFQYITSHNVIQCNFNAAKRQMIVTSHSKKGSMEMGTFFYGDDMCGIACFINECQQQPQFSEHTSFRLCTGNSAPRGTCAITKPNYACTSSNLKVSIHWKQVTRTIMTLYSKMFTFTKRSSIKTSRKWEFTTITLSSAFLY